MNVEVLVQANGVTRVTSIRVEADEPSGTRVQVAVAEVLQASEVGLFSAVEIIRQGLLVLEAEWVTVGVIGTDLRDVPVGVLGDVAVGVEVFSRRAVAVAEEEVAHGGCRAHGERADNVVAYAYDRWSMLPIRSSKTCA